MKSKQIISIKKYEKKFKKQLCQNKKPIFQKSIKLNRFKNRKNKQNKTKIRNKFKTKKEVKIKIVYLLS